MCGSSFYTENLPKENQGKSWYVLYHDLFFVQAENKIAIHHNFILKLIEVIRKYRDSDKEKIIELLRLNTPEYFAPSEEEDLIDYLNHHSENYFVIEAENEIVGCGGINSTDHATNVRIAWDIIHPKSQGKGYGSELTKFRIQKIKEMDGVKTITVRTSQLCINIMRSLVFKPKKSSKIFGRKDMIYTEWNMH